MVPTTMASTAPASLHSGHALDSSAVSGFDASSTSAISEDASPQDSTTALIPGLSMSDNKRTSKKRSHAASSGASTPADADAELSLKRQRNNIAAKKYRQKRIDRIEELESEVEAVKRERDELRIKLARQEAETAALREMLKLGVSKGPE